MKRNNIKLRLTLTEPMLATCPGDKELYEGFVASKAETATAAAEELAALPVAEQVERGSTVFLRDQDGTPLLMDYQVKGTIKELLGNLIELGDCPISKYAVKRIVNGFVHVYPRRIRLSLPPGGSITSNQRPLRAETLQGDRVCLARSEQIPAGTTCELTITVLEPTLKRKRGQEDGPSPDTLTAYVMESLKLGEFKGLGCWRSAGWGRFAYEVLA